jgi:hypothetical protein
MELVGDRLRGAMGATTGTRYPDSLPATWLSVRLGIDPAKIDAMRRAGDLIAVREPGSTQWFYPAWQFDGSKPRHAIPRIVAVARERGLDETRLYELLTAPLGLVGGRHRRLADLLAEGRDDDVVEAVRAG